MTQNLLNFPQIIKQQTTVQNENQITIPQFTNLKLILNPSLEVLEISMLHPERPNYTIACLQDFLSAFHWAKEQYITYYSKTGNQLFKYLVTSCDLESIYNYGGDLGLFVKWVEKKDRASLWHYANLCIENQFLMYSSLDLPIITIALVEGDALGGGLEFALMHDIVIAKEGVKLGFPECRFNLFPGMGAYSQLTRYLSKRDRNDILLSGKLYDAGEMLDIGLIDEVFSSASNKSLDRLINKLNKNYLSKQNHYKLIKKVNPIQKEELLEITNQWVNSALNLDKFDVRKMAAIAKAQSRKKQNLESNTTYVLPETEAEAKRLSDQASIFEKETRKFIAKIGLKKGAKCLDIGCGPGDVMQIMGELVGMEGQVTGMDINEPLGRAAIERLHKNVKSQFKFIKGNISEDQNGLNSSFDLVFARFLLLHVPDPIAALQRMWDMVKPGGKLMLMDYDFRTMSCIPEFKPVAKLTEIIQQVFVHTGLDPERGFKIPHYFESSGIGKPDKIEVVEKLVPIREVLHVLQATFESFLPAALKFNIIDEKEAKQVLKEIYEIPDNSEYYFLLPLVVGAFKEKK